MSTGLQAGHDRARPCAGFCATSRCSCFSRMVFGKMPAKFKVANFRCPIPTYPSGGKVNSGNRRRFMLLFDFALTADLR